MDAFVISTLSVASAEMGDKTQLLALLLASRFKKPALIIAGIFFATLLNHTLAALLGDWVGNHLQGKLLHALLALSFLIAALWVLKPDTLDTHTHTKNTHYKNVFMTTTFAFFMAEMGDKTQIATALMAAQFQTLIPVIIGTTIGMLLANIPVVLLGDKATRWIPINIVRITSASIFFLLGLWEVGKVLIS